MRLLLTSWQSILRLWLTSCQLYLRLWPTSCQPFVRLWLSSCWLLLGLWLVPWLTFCWLRPKSCVNIRNHTPLLQESCQTWMLLSSHRCHCLFPVLQTLPLSSRRVDGIYYFFHSVKKYIQKKIFCDRLKCLYTCIKSAAAAAEGELVLLNKGGIKAATWGNAKTETSSWLKVQLQLRTEDLTLEQSVTWFLCDV